MKRTNALTPNIAAVVLFGTTTSTTGTGTINRGKG